MSSEPLNPSLPGYWQGTLLKCPGCRLKFPFAEGEHAFAERKAALRSDPAVKTVPMTRCPRCDGWIPFG